MRFSLTMRNFENAQLCFILFAHKNKNTVEPKHFKTTKTMKLYVLPFLATLVLAEESGLRGLRPQNGGLAVNPEQQLTYFSPVESNAFESCEGQCIAESANFQSEYAQLMQDTRTQDDVQRLINDSRTAFNTRIDTSTGNPCSSQWNFEAGKFIDSIYEAGSTTPGGRGGIGHGTTGSSSSLERNIEYAFRSPENTLYRRSFNTQIFRQVAGSGGTTPLIPQRQNQLRDLDRDLNLIGFNSGQPETIMFCARAGSLNEGEDYLSATEVGVALEANVDANLKQLPEAALVNGGGN